MKFTYLKKNEKDYFLTDESLTCGTAWLGCKCCPGAIIFVEFVSVLFTPLLLTTKPPPVIAFPMPPILLLVMIIFPPAVLLIAENKS